MSMTMDLSSTSQMEPQQTTLSTLLGQDKSEEQLLNFVTTAYKQIKSRRSSTERQWYINLAFYFGRQYVAVQTVSTANNTFRLYVPPAPPWRVRLTINRIRPTVRKELASLFGQKPRFTVVPATTEDTDLVAARAGEQIFDWVYDSKHVYTATKQAGWWACNTGTGFIKTYWNPDSHDKLSDQKGDICIEAVTPFNIFVPDFRAVDIEQQPYVIHASTQTKDWVKQNWPSIKGDLPGTTEAILDDSYLNISGARKPSSEQILVLECWIKPRMLGILPKGGCITVVGGHIAQVVKEYPYKHGMYPFAKLENIPSGKFYGESMVTDLIPVQKEYNRTRSQIVESKNMMGKPKLLASRGSVDASKITSEPGQVVFYQPGYPAPVPLTMPELPGYIMEQVQQLENDINDLSGIRDPGTSVPSGTSATALSFLQEQDDAMLADTTDSLEAAIEKTGALVLSYANQYWDQPRRIKIIGTDGSFDASVLKGSDLNGNTDLRVESGSALPTSKAAKQAFIMDLIKLGAVPIDQALELLEIGGIEKVYDDYLADKHQAQRENLRLQAWKQGDEVLKANEWDNHQVHITEHNRFRKSTTFEVLPVESKVLIQNHVMAHQAALINQNGGDPTGAGPGMPSELPNAANAEEQQEQQPPGNTGHGSPYPPMLSALNQADPTQPGPDPTMGGLV